MSKIRLGSMPRRKNDKSLFVRIFSGFLLFFCTACFSAVFFGSIDYFGRANAANTDVSVTISPVLSIRTVKNSADITELTLDVDPLPSGRFVKDDLDVVVATSNPTGYSLTLANKDTDTRMHHTDSVITSTIASISTNTTEASFPLNSWGYSLDPKEIDNSGTMENNTNQTFSAIPSSTTPANLKTTDAPTTGDTTPVTFATKVDTTITAGTYSDVVVFSAVTNYVPPTTATFTVSPVKVSNLTGGDTITLDTDINWIDNIGQILVTIYSTPTNGANCTNPTAVKNSTSGTDKLSITCTSPARSVGTYNVDLELVRFNQKYTATNAIEYIEPFGGITNMQQMTNAICANSAIGGGKILTDTRDSKTYVVKKLADGKCWMVQNLRLGGSSAITLTPQDSNVTANFTLSATTNSFGTTNDAAGININRVHDNGNTWLNGTSVQTSGTPPSQTQYMGNYYNWYTATAGSGTYSTGSNVIATQSICPKGWRLPKGGAINATTGNGEFQKLYDAYGNYADFISNTSAVLSGYWANSSAGDQGILGVWWSSTANNSTLGYSLRFSSSSVSPQYVNYERVGNSVRCLAE